MTYKVSIILPVYNVAQYVMRCLESLSSQTLQDIEVVFIDDKGNDNSIEIIQDYIASHHLEANWHIISSSKNKGQQEAVL